MAQKNIFSPIRQHIIIACLLFGILGNLCTALLWVFPIIGFLYRSMPGMHEGAYVCFHAINTTWLTVMGLLFSICAIIGILFTQHSVFPQKKCICVLLGGAGFFIIPSYQYLNYYNKKAEFSHCLTNLQSIRSAEEEWLTTHTTFKDISIDWKDIVGSTGCFLRNSPVCPAGGMYKLGNINEPVSCTVHGEFE